MNPTDFIKKQKTASGSMTDVLKRHNRDGTLNQTAKPEQITPVPSRVTTPTSTQETTPTSSSPGFIRRQIETIKATAKGEISFKDFAKAVPGSASTVFNTVADAVAPSLNKFRKVTGGIIGEGIAYAVDKNVREQYNAGNLDVLPMVTAMTPSKVAKYTIAAGLEAAIFRSFPNAVQMKLAPRGGVGALQGIGMAISTGLSQDKKIEDIIKDIPTYGVGGGILSIIFPYLVPLMKTEINALPAELRKVIKGVDKVAKETTEASRKLTPTVEFPAPTRVPISTPNTRYQAYLRSQGYEPYVPEAKMPVIDAGEVPKKDLSGMIDIEGNNLPNVGPKIAETPSLYEPYTPESELPTIDFGDKPKTRSKATDIQMDAPDTVVDLPPPPGTRLVPVDKPAKTSRTVDTVKSPTVQTPVAAKSKKPVDERDITIVPLRESRKTAVEAGREAQAPLPRRTVSEPEPMPEMTTETFQGVPMIKAEPPAPKITKVPAAQMPVGEGKTKVSRLEERMRKTLDDANASRLDGENLATYKQMNKKEQITKDATLVESSQDDAMKILRGEKNIPEGNTFNGIALALAKKAELEGDAALATRLASLRSTRAGQEISLLTEADPDSAISVIDDIITARKVGRTRKTTGVKERGIFAPSTKMAKEKTSQEVSATVAKGKKELDIARLKIDEAEQLLNDILC